eukprot:1025278-Prorocentrum_minimum.AAC.1
MSQELTITIHHGVVRGGPLEGVDTGSRGGPEGVQRGSKGGAHHPPRRGAYFKMCGVSGAGCEGGRRGS